MKGRDVRVLRTEMKLSVPAMATLLGIHASSLYRWEQASASRLADTIGLAQRRILECLRDAKPARRRAVAWTLVKVDHPGHDMNWRDAWYVLFAPETR